MDIKNTKYIKTHSTSNYEVVGMRNRRDKISKEYLNNLYKWILLNDLYLDNLVMPNEEKMALGYEDRYIMTFVKYCTTTQDELGYNDECRGLYYRTFGYMPEIELCQKDPRFKK